jgi:DNA-binding transcriptional ArsR family regulator
MAQPESVHNSTFNWTTILKALADENRLQIIHELLKQEATVQDLSTILDIQMYNISKHLKILEANGLVRKRKDGIHRIYHVTENFRSRLSDNNQVLDLGCCKFIFGNSVK